MRILEGEKDVEFTSLHVESDDDLWYLHNIISPGDRVKMTVMRRLENGFLPSKPFHIHHIHIQRFALS